MSRATNHDDAAVAVHPIDLAWRFYVKFRELPVRLLMAEVQTGMSGSTHRADHPIASVRVLNCGRHLAGALFPVRCQWAFNDRN